MQKRFSNRINITPEVLVNIAKIDELKGLWQGSLRLSPQILGRLKRSVIITSTGASTRIEGAEMSDEEITRFLRGLKSNPPKNRDEEEVAGYADLTGRIFDHYKTFKLTEGQILQFHSILLQCSKKDTLHRGRYKAKDNIVAARDDEGKERILFRPTPPYLVKKEMDDVLTWTHARLTEKKLHPILVLCNFIFEFLAVHPFEDGNGRLSRALTNLLLLQQGYSYVPYVSLEEIVEDSQEEYYRSLRATQRNHKTSNEDITPWVLYMLEALLKQAEKAREIMDVEQPEKLLLVWRLFAERAELGVADIASKLKQRVPKATVKQALSRLVTLGMIERIGQGRATRYRKPYI
jgi:Fic family protein